MMGNSFRSIIIAIVMALAMVVSCQTVAFADDQVQQPTGDVQVTEPTQPADPEEPTTGDPGQGSETESTEPSGEVPDIALEEEQLGITPWKYSTSGLYKVLLRPDGSVFELRTAAGQKIGYYEAVQGACLADGIGYFSMPTRKDSTLAKIVKVDMSDMSIIAVSEPLKLYHANDMAYNTKEDVIVVAHAEGDRKGISIVDPETLTVIGTKHISVSTKCGMTASEVSKYIGFGAIAYNEKHDQYVVRLNNLTNLLTLDSDFKPVKYIKLSKKIKQIYQGLDSVDDYFLVGESPKKSKQYNFIAVYDYDGKYIRQIKIRKTFELEGVTHDDENLYVCMYEEGSIKGKAEGTRNDFVMQLGAGDGLYQFPVFPVQDSEVDLVNGTIRSWFDSYTENKIGTIKTGKDIYHADKAIFRWSVDDGVKGPYKVYISEESDMSPCRTIKASTASLKVSNLKTGTKYYWQVSSTVSKKTKMSNIGTFTTAEGPRTVTIDKVSNTRDIGGWSTGDGVIKQGMVYRSAKLDKISSSGKKVVLNVLKVKTDLDLRQKGSGLAGKKSPLGKSVKYIQFGKEGGVFNEDADTASGMKMIGKEMRVFADESNYPIIVHCKIGRDRTGLACYLLEALCGVSSDDLVKEYQMSFLSKEGCTYMGRFDAGDYSQIRMIENLVRSYGEEGDSLQVCTENYLKACGLTDEELDSIQNILVEDN